MAFLSSALWQVKEGDWATKRPVAQSSNYPTSYSDSNQTSCT